MAKGKSGGENRKVTFGKRRTGSYKKSSGPKEKAVKARYRGQGR